MPCLVLNTNQVLDADRKTAVCLALSSKTAEILGKPESYVMVLVNTQQTMSFAGTADPCAYIELKSIGLPENQTTELSSQLCASVSELCAIEQNRIYIEFSDAQRHMWGWDGGTF